jgi:lysophospholipase L1-like esterase
VKPGYVFLQRWRYGEPNLVRRQFNDKIKEVFQNDPIFDLAAIEARYAEDYSLSKNLTDDGGHLNELGRRLVASEFVKFLSTIPTKE